MTAPLRERLEAVIAHIHTYQGNPTQCEKHIATLTEALSELAEREKEARWKRMAEYEYGRHMYPDKPELAEGALDAYLQTNFDGKDEAIDAAIKEKK